MDMSSSCIMMWVKRVLSRAVVATVQITVVASHPASQSYSDYENGRMGQAWLSTGRPSKVKQVQWRWPEEARRDDKRLERY